MLRSMILGFVVTLSPFLLGAQGLSPAAVIPTQALIPRGSVFLRGAPMTDAPAAKAVPVCSMPWRLSTLTRRALRTKEVLRRRRIAECRS